MSKHCTEIVIKNSTSSKEIWVANLTYHWYTFFIDDTAGKQVKIKFSAVNDNRVSGIVAALKIANETEKKEEDSIKMFIPLYGSSCV